MLCILICFNLKEKNLKTFSKPIYFWLGLFLSGLGLYYFTTQFNDDRIEEWLPLGISLILGLYLILGNRANWLIPGSKYSLTNHDFIYDPEQKILQVVFSSSRVSHRIDQTIDLSDAEEIDILVKNSSYTQKETNVVQDPLKILPLAQASPTGVYTRTTSTTYQQTFTILKLMPSEKEVHLMFPPKNRQEFKTKLNELL